MPSNEPSTCVDEPGWETGGNDPTLSGAVCSDLGTEEDWCGILNDPEFEFESKLITTACCLCGGSIHQSTAPSIAPSISSSPSTCNDDPDWQFVLGMGCDLVTHVDFCLLKDLTTAEPASTACCACINNVF